MNKINSRTNAFGLLTFIKQKRKQVIYEYICNSNQPSLKLNSLLTTRKRINSAWPFRVFNGDTNILWMKKLAFLWSSLGIICELTSFWIVRMRSFWSKSLTRRCWNIISKSFFEERNTSTMRDLLMWFFKFGHKDWVLMVFGCNFFANESHLSCCVKVVYHGKEASLSLFSTGVPFCENWELHS